MIGVHGEEGTWLWDPYLDAIDIMGILFLSPHSGADLRALSGGASRKGLSISDYIAGQSEVLGAVTGNLLGLCLEYRIPYQLSPPSFMIDF